MQILEAVRLGDVAPPLRTRRRRGLSWL